jgi:hypothetical protein
MEARRIVVLLSAATRGLSLRSVQTGCGVYQNSYETGKGGYFWEESDRCVRLNIHLHLEQCGGKLVLHTSNLNTSKPFADCKPIVIKKSHFFTVRLFYIKLLRK